MRNIIYYFSGTGNSLQVARDLSTTLGDAELIPMSGVKESDVQANSVGFVFPVYLWGMPNIVEDFIKSIKNTAFSGYLYAIATYYKDPGDAIGQIMRLLKRNGLRLSAGFTVSMPGNNIIFYETDTVEIRDRKLSACKEIILDIAHDVSEGIEKLPDASLLDRLIKTGLLHTILLKTFKNSDKNFRTEESCNGCGICAEVCPAYNIKPRDGRPVWQSNCNLCLSCINLCPQNAIEFGKTTSGKKRYINPKTEVKDFLKKTGRSI